MRNYLLIIVGFLLVSGINVRGQSGGNFVITESVIAAGGGQQSSGGTFSLDGTVGQNAAGDAIRGTPFAVTSGFWNFTPLAPTAALVGISGQVRTSSGAGISNAVLTLVGQDGSTRSSRSSSFGYFHFDEVMAGERYVLSVSSRRFTFSQPTILISVLDQMIGLDFVAEPF